MSGAVSSARLFQNLRGHLLRNSFGVMLQGSCLRVLTIVLCSAVIWGLLFAVGMLGFQELKVRWEVPLDGFVLELLFDLLFFSLTVLLIFSTGIILYASLFGSPESAFLLSTPVPDDQIFAYKYQGAVAFSSWGFLLLGSPILIAYGLRIGDGAPWYFYAALPLFFLGFVLIPGSLGAMLTLVLVNFLPRHLKQIVAVVVFGLVILFLFWSYGALRGAVHTPSTRTWFDNVFAELAIFGGRLVPFQWIARGLVSSARGEVGTMLYYLALVWSNGLFLYVVAAWMGKRLLRRGYNLVATGGSLRKSYGGHWLDSLFTRVIFFLSPQTRTLIVKDFRTFRRDPAQWAQILIFLSLGVLYFANMRRFYEQDINRSFKNGISLLTLTATAFLTCAYTGRFIFPMLSLEGKKFWILGLLPLERDRLVWGKFAFAAAATFGAAEFIVLFSNLMLGMPWQVLLVHSCVVAVYTLGLSGLSVGLGALMPNFRETDPSKIAVGFGGTLNLVAGLLLLLVVIALMALPLHLQLATSLEAPFERGVPWWMWGLVVVGGIVGVLATLWPLRAGVRNLRGLEF